MSQQPINHNFDMKRLTENGYRIAIRANHLVLYRVPYVNAHGEIQRGDLVSSLEMAGDVMVTPQDHKAMFRGDLPCDKDGRALTELDHGTAHIDIGDGVIEVRLFSRKPSEGYQNYFQKMTHYTEMISKHARDIDPDATAQEYKVIESQDQNDVFKYCETASGLAGISVATRKLELPRIGIIGLGGTGSYVLDFLAKTPVNEIHLFDSDDFLQHNAFRSPGAASSEELGSRLKKVNYFASKYAQMRNHIFPHTTHLNETNLNLLDRMSFVFICIDDRAAKLPIVGKLEADGIPFIDTGMGIELADNKLFGIIRTTTSTEAKRDHFAERVPHSGEVVDNLYSANIQIAELNALNAAFAIIRWKKHFEFYADFENEHNCNYTLDGNDISNTDTL